MKCEKVVNSVAGMVISPELAWGKKNNTSWMDTDMVDDAISFLKICLDYRLDNMCQLRNKLFRIALDLHAMNVVEKL